MRPLKFIYNKKITEFEFTDYPESTTHVFETEYFIFGIRVYGFIQFEERSKNKADICT